VKAATWDACHLTAVSGLPGADAAEQWGMAVGHVFVAKHRVQEMLQEEVRAFVDGVCSGAEHGGAHAADIGRDAESGEIASSG
jgi:RNA polymerase sigma-70 factor (ECF subfamily)